MKESDKNLNIIIDNNGEYEENNISRDSKLGHIYRNLNDVKARLTFIIDMKKRFAADESKGRKSDKKSLRNTMRLNRTLLKDTFPVRIPKYTT